MYNHKKITPTQYRSINGVRLYMLRTKHRLTQQQLANMVGVTFQQIQKYEKGTNALSGYRLFQLSNIFDEPIEYFYKPLLQIGYERKYTSENTIK